MPYHGHQVSLHNSAGTLGTAYYYNGATKTNSTGAQAPAVTWKGATFSAAQSGRGDQAGGADPVGGGSGHTHTLSSHTHTLSSHTHTTNVMPPYIAVYVWQRTA